MNKVKDQVRNRQKRMSNVAESGDEHSIIWGMFMATTLNAATFMGKNFSTIQSVVKNFEDLTLKQMFDVTAGHNCSELVLQPRAQLQFGSQVSMFLRENADLRRQRPNRSPLQCLSLFPSQSAFPFQRYSQGRQWLSHQLNLPVFRPPWPVF